MSFSQSRLGFNQTQIFKNKKSKHGYGFLFVVRLDE
jgi:hypothetical protein